MKLKCGYLVVKQTFIWQLLHIEKVVLLLLVLACFYNISWNLKEFTFFLIYIVLNVAHHKRCSSAPCARAMHPVMGVQLAQ